MIKFHSFEGKNNETGCDHFSEMSRSQHLLHDICPPLLPHGKRLTILQHKTNRRMSSFVRVCARVFNEITSNAGLNV